LSTFIKRSFSSGEIAPSLYARADLVKYETGLRTCRNGLVMRHGGVASRPGTTFVGEVKDSSKTVRLIEFIFNASQTYILEFGDLYMRVIRNGAQLTLTAQDITSITNASQGVLTYSGADNYSNGDEIYISGIVGAIGSYLNGRNFLVSDIDAGNNTMKLKYLNGTYVNTTSMGSYTSGGSIAEVYTIATPYVEADISTLQYVQSADVITIVHPNYAPRKLSRTGHTSWTLSLIEFDPEIGRPTGGTGTAGAGGAINYRYRVTTVAEETYEESYSGFGASQAITGITKANPAVVTYSGADNFENGDEIYIASVGGMVEVNGLKFTVANLNAGANTFELSGIDSTGYTTYTSGGTVACTYIKINSAAAPTTSNPHTLSWTAVTGAQEYNVYRANNGVYGFIGVAGSTSFSDDGVITPDGTETPPLERELFGESGAYPSAVTYAQQRLFIANTDDEPEKIWGSKTGNFSNFNTSSPIQDDDAVTFTLAGRQVNEVLHMLDLGKLVVFTSGGEHAIEGDQAGNITPGNINPKQHSYNGSTTLKPIIVGSTAIHVQARGSIVRDLGFDYQVDGYRGNDLTIFAAHLFDGYTLIDWAYQQIPHSIIWAVRSDGTLLGLTYIREHQILGWHRHDFDGTVENVCVVPEGDEDFLYLVINRTIDGSTKRYIERMSTRQVDDIVDYIGLDCSLSYDGRHTGVNTMTLTGSGWTYTDTLTLTSVSTAFASTDVGNQVHLTGSDGEIIRFTIDAYSNSSVVTGRPNRTVPASMRGTVISTWAIAVDQVGGLWHLEGEDVSVFADGFVVANPNNASYDVLTVTNGSITLDKPYSVIHVGLPITFDIETLDIDFTSVESIADKKKFVNKVSAFVEKSRGMFVGSKPPTDDDTDNLDGLIELKIRDEETYDEPVALTTDVVDVIIRSEWNSNGRIFIRQVDPVPLTILSVAPSGLAPVGRG